MGWPDERFVSKNENPDLGCAICFEVMRDAVFVCTNQHAMCAECVSSGLAQCPECRQPISSAPARLIRNMVNRLVISCSYKTQGCVFTSAIEAMPTHEGSCDCIPMTCGKAGCNATFPRKDQALHEQRSCRMTLAPCEHCGLVCPRSSVDAHSCVRVLKDLIDEQSGVIEEQRRLITAHGRKIDEQGKTIEQLQQQRPHGEAHGSDSAAVAAAVAVTNAKDIESLQQTNVALMDVIGQSEVKIDALTEHVLALTALLQIPLASHQMPHPNHQHMLRFMQEQTRSWFCDGCTYRSSTNPTIPRARYRCTAGCDFDLCIVCYSKR